MRELILKVGPMLYGPNYKRSLAKDLDVTERTMQRWVTGENEPPDSLKGELWDLVSRRIADLKAIRF